MIDKPDIQADDELVTTETSEEEAVETGTASSGPKSRGGAARFALFLSILALFFTAAGVVAGYKHWQRMNDKARSNQGEIASLQKKLTDMPTVEAFTALRTEVEDKVGQAQQQNAQSVQEMTRLQNQTRQFADTVAVQVEQITQLQGRLQASAKPATARDWQIAEVEFLLQLANRELHLSRDVSTTEAALKEADKILAGVGSVSYLPVRQQIAHDLAALEALAAPDIAALSQRITAMMLKLKPLPAVDTGAAKGKPLPLGEMAGQGPEPQAGQSSWDKYKNDVLKTLGEAVVIRKFDKPIQADLDVDARQNLYNLLQLRLETLRLQVLRGMDAGFHAQLDLLRNTVRMYYPEAQTTPLLAELDDLDKVNLEPVLPDISGSLRQLESARHAEADSGETPPAADAPGAEGGKKQ